MLINRKAFGDVHAEVSSIKHDVGIVQIAADNASKASAMFAIAAVVLNAILEPNEHLSNSNSFAVGIGGLTDW